MSNGSIPKSKRSDSVVQFSVNDKFFSQNCTSSPDSQQAFYSHKEMKEPSPSCETDFINTAPRTFEDVWFKEIAQEKPSKYRVKSAPCRSQLMFRRKARSAGKKYYTGLYYIVLSCYQPLFHRLCFFARLNLP